MIKVVLRNYNKYRGKVLYSGNYASTVKDFISHRLLEKLNAMNKLDNTNFKDEDDFIDIEKNGTKLIYTMHDLDIWSLSQAINSLNNCK